MNTPPIRTALRVALATATCALSLAATAAPDEIVVFTDEFTKRGEIGVDLHFNYAARARNTPDYAGEQAPDRILRFMPEVVWGLSDKWNFGLHVPMSYNTATRTTTFDGVKARMLYLDVKEKDGDSTFWGVNYELAYLDQRVSETRWNLELRGILGMRRGDWMFALNPILSRPLSKAPGVDNRFSFDLSGKVMRSFGEHLAVGVEHYSEYGQLRRPDFGPGAGQTTYLIAEFKTRSDIEIQVGVGHGWTDSVDKRVYKVLVGLPF